MYTVLLLLMIAFFLISSNWAVGVTFIGVSAAIVAGRVGKEEAMMVKKFGNKYHDYQRQTGSLLTTKFFLLVVLLTFIVFTILYLLSSYGLALLTINIGLFQPIASGHERI